ncbi:MAG: VOC family protein, partial [Acidobacteria bacterium]|nr:VOC family protein [Acidobacteriota bacterium]
SDLDRSIDFYVGVLGFELMRKTTVTAYLHKGTDLLELMQAHDPVPPRAPETAAQWNEKMWSRPGVVHLGFRVDDMDEAIRKLTDAGGELVAPPIEYTPEIIFVTDPEDDKLKRASRPLKNPFWRIAMFRDPDGMILEILER